MAGFFEPLFFPPDNAARSNARTMASISPPRPPRLDPLPSDRFDRSDRSDVTDERGSNDAAILAAMLSFVW